MKNIHTSVILMVAIMAAFFAYMTIDILIREYATRITAIDLMVLFVLGLISGMAVGVALALNRNQITAD
jgi:hypothetical protein